MEKHIDSVDEEFDSEEFRYNHRFGPFANFNTPPLCNYFQFKEKDEQFVQSFAPIKLYTFAQEHFDMARNIFDKHPEYQAVNSFNMFIL